MKKYLIIGVALLLTVAVLATLYFTRVAPYKKVIKQLNNHNWGAAIGLCRSRLMNNPNNYKYMGLQLYASIRKNSDEKLEDIVRDVEDESDLREINSMLYRRHKLHEILVELSTLEYVQYIIDNNLYSKGERPKETVKEVLRRMNKELSTNFKNTMELVKAVKYMSEVGMNKLKLSNEDPVDNYYHNCFLMVQSSEGNPKADELLVKKYNIDSSIATLFPYCGKGLQKPLKKLLQTNPDFLELQGAIDYLAIMKATDMITEINKKYPKITDLSTHFYDDKVKEEERESRYAIYEAWRNSKGREVSLTNPHFVKQRTTVLKGNKKFGMNISIQQPSDEGSPILLSLTAYDTKGKKFVLWPYVYKSGEFTPLTIEKRSIPLVSSKIVTIFHADDDGDKQTFALGEIESSREEYYEAERRYNPHKNRYYDYWSERYEYYGGYEYVDVRKFRNTPTLKNGAKYHLLDTEAAMIEKIENDDFNDIYHNLRYGDDEDEVHEWDWEEYSVEEVPVDHYY